jgi:Ca2+-binding RTX toxin-like protein
LLGQIRFADGTVWDSDAMHRPTGSVTFTGISKEGQQLTANNSIADVDGVGSITYHWMANDTELAIGESYTLTSSEVGKAISVVASYTDLQGNSESVTSTTTPTVLEGVAPTVTNFSPADAVTGVALGSNIILTFSEAIQTGTGSISIRDGSASGIVLASYDVVNSQNLAISGNTLTINPSNDLSSNTHYFVTIDATAIQDLAGNAYAGTDAYDFTTSYNVIIGTSVNDNLLGTVNDDQLSGLAGNDTINGATGNDTLTGGSGGDTFIVSSGTDSIIDLGLGGVDILNVYSGATANATVASNWTATSATSNDGAATIDASGKTISLASSTGTVGFTLNNSSSTGVSIRGSKLADTLVSGSGADTLVGGAGDDNYTVDLTLAGAIQDTVTEATNAGADTVLLRGVSTNLSATTITLVTNVETLNASQTGSSLLNLTGNTAANTLIGNVVNNVLSGGTGADTLIGGLGDDVYIVDNVNDVITEISGEGIDLIQSSVTYTASANVENLTLTGTAAINATGNDLVNTLIGNSGNNMLNGGTGADTMLGGSGNDTYVVDDLADVVYESTTATSGVDAGGTDLVQVAIATFGGTYTLNSFIEKATLTNAVNFNLTGNDAANTLTGNAAANILDGGAGVDTLIGGLGDDIYVVDLMTAAALQDTIIEAASAGTDTLQLRGASTNLTAKTLTLASNLENLDASKTSSSKLNLTGNSVDNILTGNAANNILNGGIGADSLLGGKGNDTYYVDNLGDLVIENANEGTDDVVSSISYTLRSNVENLTLTGNAAINATGNALANTLNGNNGNNILDGGAGNDTLQGAGGNDTYMIDSANDLIIEAVNAGYDTVKVAINAVNGSYTLADNVETSILVNSVDFNLTGNSLANTLTGNSSANVFDGGTGVDTLSGGLGNDTYIVDLTSNALLEDTVTEGTNSGVDTLQLRGLLTKPTFSTVTLAVNLENLDVSLTGLSLLNLTGNGASNLLIGNEADNVLDGGVGADSMFGGAGNDTYVIDNADDAVYETISQIGNADAGGIDSVKVAISTANGSYSLGNYIENAVLINTVAFSMTGNALNNSLTGNAASNTLNGGNGNDILIGGLGNDTLTGGAGKDVFLFNTAANASTNKDMITDFVSGTDKLQFSKSIFKLGAVGNLTAAEFKSGNFTGGQDATDRIVYNTSTGALYYDADGNGVAGAVQIALIGTATHPSLAYTDIQIIA